MSNQRLNPQVPRRVGKARPATGIPWALLSLVLALHLIVGLLLSVFSPPYWVWPLALGGTLMQAVVLAGPKALSSFTGFRILLSRFVTCLGTAMSVVALAIAVGFGGTSDIDLIKFTQIGLALFFINLDRKSTRLNSSHLVISYAVFCLKKKISKLEAFIMKHC